VTSPWQIRRKSWCTTTVPGSARSNRVATASAGRLGRPASSTNGIRTAPPNDNDFHLIGDHATLIENRCHYQEVLVSAICQATGRKPGFGKQVSHSHKRTSRRWNPNVQRRRYLLRSEGRTITLTVSAKGIKTIDRKGIEAVVAELRRKGVRV
jgi:large subunit ribosomal protein L28